jgi:hypothetical protein
MALGHVGEPVLSVAVKSAHVANPIASWLIRMDSSTGKSTFRMYAPNSRQNVLVATESALTVQTHHRNEDPVAQRSCDGRSGGRRSSRTNSGTILCRLPSPDPVRAVSSVKHRTRHEPDCRVLRYEGDVHGPDESGTGRSLEPLPAGEQTGLVGSVAGSKPFVFGVIGPAVKEVIVHDPAGDFHAEITSTTSGGRVFVARATPTNGEVEITAKGDGLDLTRPIPVTG